MTIIYRIVSEQTHPDNSERLKRGMYLTKHKTGAGSSWAVDGRYLSPDFRFSVLMQQPQAKIKTYLETRTTTESAHHDLLPPVESDMEVWAAGVTYFRSRNAREAEIRGQRPEIRGQKSEARGQKTETGGQKAEDRGQKSEARSQRPEARRQRPEDRNQRPETRRQRIEVRGRRTEIRGQGAEIRDRRIEGRGQKSEDRNQRPEVRSQRTGTGDYVWSIIITLMLFFCVKSIKFQSNYRRRLLCL